MPQVGSHIVVTVLYRFVKLLATELLFFEATSYYLISRSSVKLLLATYWTPTATLCFSGRKGRWSKSLNQHYEKYLLVYVSFLEFYKIKFYKCFFPRFLLEIMHKMSLLPRVKFTHAVNSYITKNSLIFTYKCLIGLTLWMWLRSFSSSQSCA